MDCDLVGGVTRATALVVVPVAVVAAALAGWVGATGALAGALVSLVSFRWIARASRGAGLLFAGGAPVPCGCWASAPDTSFCSPRSRSACGAASPIPWRSSPACRCCRPS